MSNKYIFSGSDDQSFNVWDIEDVFQITLVKSLKFAHYGMISFFSEFYDNKYIFTGGYDSCLKTWNIENINSIQCEAENKSNGPLTCCSNIFSEHFLITADLHGMVILWNIVNIQNILSFPNKQFLDYTIFSLSKVLDGMYFLACGRASDIELWHIEENQTFEYCMKYSVENSCYCIKSY